MVAYCIAARFPLGVYLGHTGDANRDRFPDPARLQAALLNAAASGSQAVMGENGLQPSDDALNALRWIDNNPPTALAIPENQWVATATRRMMYRNVSSARASKGVFRPATEERAVSDGVAVNGDFGFLWDSMPEEVSSIIDGLLADVPCLGEASSLVILENRPVKPNFILDPEATPFTPHRLRVRVPESGRSEHLIGVFNSSVKRKNPSKAADAYRKSDEIHNPPLANDCVAQASYKSVVSEEATTPWSEVILVETIGKQLQPSEYVAACVALHKAIIARIRTDVSPVITGRYPSDGNVQPANHMAIQYLPHEYVKHLGLNSSVFALLMPRGTDATTYEQIGKALTGNFPLRKQGKLFCHLKFNGRVIRADEFWLAPLQGMARLWRPLVAFVPESRVLRDKQDKTAWTLKDAGLVSIAHVWRERFNSDKRGSERYRQLRDKVQGAGVQVFSARPVTDQVRKLVHKTNKNLTLQPWTGEVYLNGVLPDTAIASLGQSRHLGGGLLIPIDVPTVEVNRLFEKGQVDE